MPDGRGFVVQGTSRGVVVMPYRGYQPPGEAPVLDGNPVYFDEGTRTEVMSLRRWERHGRREAIRALQSGRTMLYAARVEGDLIKIGCTSDLYTRLAHLKGELLAFRFGDFDEERDLHETLKASVHHGREWYHPTREVVAVVNEMRAEFNLDPIDA